MRRGPTWVCQGLHLHILAGAVFWVVGPNGSGKTSLLRVMAGMDRPHAGAVTRWGSPTEELLYFHAEMALPPSATVGDWDRLVRRLLPTNDQVPPTPLWPHVDPGRRIGRLSTGERKRLLLDALFRRRGSLLLDEPFDHLSPDARAALGRLITARARTHVVVVATNQATTLAARDGGLRLDSGVAVPLEPASPRTGP